MVPGVYVAQIDSSTWAVTARGFNRRYANKLLVLVDGRSVYNNLYSGVFWDQVDLLLEDVDRIEVIRGPGATMWGANAVNGVINIITLAASQTEGTLVTTGAGSQQRGAYAVRHGGKIGDKISYRGWAGYAKRDHLQTPEDQAAGDSWDTTRGGGRLDWQASERDSLSFQGDLYRGGEQQVIEPD